MSDIPSVTLNNGVSIPQLGLGVFLVSNDQAFKNVSIALENGYRLIDTAAAYSNEEGVGEAIRKSGIPREEIFVMSKLWQQSRLSVKVYTLALTLTHSLGSKGRRERRRS
jgi:diketogulonate reductase-like aldo/keto reductase